MIWCNRTLLVHETEISSELRQFIGKNEDLINTNQFEKLYNKYNAVDDLTKVLLLSNIDFLEHMTYTPEDCFAGILSLIEVEIPDSITTLMQGTFFGCENLLKVHIPHSVSIIHNHCFAYCWNLEIFYDGTIKEWHDIYVDAWDTRTRDYRAENCSWKIVHCKDGDIVNKHTL